MTFAGRVDDEMPRHRRWLVLALFVALTMGLGVLGGAVTGPKIVTWYPTIAKPWFTPPNWVFPVAWTSLYLLIAFAGWRVWLKPASEARTRALKVYAVQLALNALWSPAFFLVESPLLGLIVVVPFLLSVFWTVREFRPLDRVAGAVLLPYLAWVGFASILNATILMMNWPRDI